MKNFEYRDVPEIITHAGKIVVTSHHNPDGDAIGSALAMYHFLSQHVTDVTVVVPNDFPGFLKWLEGVENILCFDRQREEAKKAFEQADLIFCLDYNALHRAGEMEKSIRKSQAERFLIDHHPEPSLEDFDYWLTLTETSSTSELIYQFISGTNKEVKLDRALAECLFVGIMTDTGSFSFACNYPETFRTAANLISAGVDAEKVHRLVYDTYSEGRLRLLGHAIGEKMVVIPALKSAYIALSQGDLDRFGYAVGDTEGVVNYPLSIDGIIVAVLLTERKDRIRVSFRSKGNFAVNQIARDHFKGGGHSNAAGGDSFESLDLTIEKLIRVLQQYQEEIDRSTL